MTLYVTIAALIVSACVLAVALIALNGLYKARREIDALSRELAELKKAQQEQAAALLKEMDKQRHMLREGLGALGDSFTIGMQNAGKRQAQGDKP